MTDNLANLRNYQIQLQQVETGLASDPDNEDFKKLQVDLQEVINLTMAIMDKDELAALENSGSNSVSHNFKAGDYVLAPWSEDGQFYEAQIEDITSDGQCTVVFSHQKRRISEVCLVELIKPLSGKRQRSSFQSSGASSSKFNQNYNAKTIGLTNSASGSDNDRAGNTMNHFKRTQEAREALKKKQQKRKDKMKVLEEEREKDKNKWQNFSNKVNSKKMKGGSSKKSIFATPESVEGRVGVGTCGVGGKPMTEYQMKMEKVKKTVTSLPKFSLNSTDEEFEARDSNRGGGGGREDHRSVGMNRNRF